MPLEERRHNLGCFVSEGVGAAWSRLLGFGARRGVVLLVSHDHLVVVCEVWLLSPISPRRASKVRSSCWAAPGSLHPVPPATFRNVLFRAGREPRPAWPRGSVHLPFP